jgi:membrane fusion protein (multidrug efflux system)
MTTNGAVNSHVVEETAKLMFREPGEPGVPPVETAEPAPAAPARRWWTLKRALLAGGLAFLVAAGVLAGPRLYRALTAYESTDDAFVEGHVIQMSPKVGGHVARLLVDDNQDVKAGDLLVEIDPRDYQARVAQARAALDAAVARARAARIGVGLTDTTSGAAVEQANANVTLSRSGVESAQAALTTAQSRVVEARARVVSAETEAGRAKIDAARYADLFREQAVSAQDRDNSAAAAQRAVAAVDEARASEQAARSALHQAQSQLAEARAKVGESLGRQASANSAPQQVAVSRAQLAVLEGEVGRTRADLDAAELNLSYTRITAPVAGRITRKSVELGALVQPGQALFALVPTDFWVVANFKETQLRDMRPGQPAEVKVDAWGGRTYRGHVDSIQTGAGARFSLLPPENATGNYVKVVQRVPVKIVFDEAFDADHPLGPGMSVVPSVKVR